MNLTERRLDQRITLERNINSVGPPDWHPLFDCWAAVDAANFTMWISADVWRYSLTIQDRVVWCGAIYYITDIQDQVRGHLTALIVNIGLSHG